MINFIKHLWYYKNIILNIILISVLLFLIIHIYNILTYKYITVEFKDLRPMRQKIDIFYKGIKIGYVRDMKLCHNCHSTLVHCVLTYKGLLLPQNTTALMKKEKKKDKEYDFIELQYPQKPSSVIIGNSSMIDGKTTVDIVHFMSNQNGDELENIKNNLAKSSEELENVLSALVDLLTTADDMLKQNQKNIYSSTYNLSQTTKTFNQLSGKIDNAIKEEELKTSIINLHETTNTLKSLTGNLNKTTDDINDSMLTQAQSTLYRAECLIANTNDIVCGVKQTLKKKFGGFRLIFGKVISD